MSETYQVRHRVFGVFQGLEPTQEGIAVCYHPAADTPEMGICEFQSKSLADSFIEWAMSVDSLEYSDGDLTVEPFNKAGSDLLQRAGLHFLTLEYWTEHGKESHSR